MSDNRTLLPGIRRIFYVDCENLPRRVDLMGAIGIPVTVLTDLTEVEFFGEATCEQSETRENNGVKSTATLIFSTAKELGRHVRIAFVIEDVNGGVWLIGGKEAPYPQISCTRRTGRAAEEAAGIDYEIKHCAVATMVKCII